MRLAAALTLVALTSAMAHAEPALAPPGLTPRVAPAPEPQPDPFYTDSYRAQVVAADGIALGLVISAGLSAAGSGHNNGTSLAELALATYAIGAPLVHLLHDRPAHAAASLGLRAGLPIMFAFAGAALSAARGCSECGDSAAGGASLGLLVGILAAVIIDPAVLARADDRPAATHLTATPLHGGGVAFGVARTF